MKVSQLLQEETLAAYTKRLTKTLGITKLGQGLYARVFQHPVYHNVAVKVVKDDPAYLIYIRWCLKHQDNPWVPKIISLVPVTLDSDDDEEYLSPKAHIVFFQKLRKASKAEIKAAITKMFQSLEDIQHFKVWRRGALARYPEYHSTTSFKHIAKPEWKYMARHSTDKHVKEISAFFARTDAWEDIHDQNVMMRDEGDQSQLVFTDPVAA